MKRMPLNPLNLVLQPNSFNNKAMSVSGLFSYPENLLAKREHNFGTESSENSNSFLQVEKTIENHLEDTASDLSSPVHSPNRSSSTKPENSSILKKSIKKESEKVVNSFKKSKAWLKLRQRNNTQASKTTETTNANQASLNITYKFTPKKLLSQLMTQEEQEKEVSIQHQTESSFKSTTSLEKKDTMTSTSSNESILQKRLAQARMKTMAAVKPFDKNIYCLNDMPSIGNVQISGIKVCLGNDGHSYSFPSDRKTVKFVV